MTANYTPDGKLDLDKAKLNTDTIVEFLRLVTNLKLAYLTAPVINELFESVFPDHKHLKEAVFSHLSFADPAEARSFLWKDKT